jgi:hypothetical protein
LVPKRAGPDATANGPPDLRSRLQAQGKRGAVWYAKYRLPDGRQQKKRLGPVWTEKTAPPDGYFTKGKAEKHLDELLRQTREGTLPGLVQTGKTFADATEEWLAYSENVRDCKPSTLRDYRNMARVLVREFGKRRIEAITTQDIDFWISGYGGSNRTRQKYLVCLGSIFRRAMKVYGLPRNPADLVERPRVRRAAKIDVLRPEEVLALVRAAESDQDAPYVLICGQVQIANPAQRSGGLLCRSESTKPVNGSTPSRLSAKRQWSYRDAGARPSLAALMPMRRHPAGRPCASKPRRGRCRPLDRPPARSWRSQIRCSRSGDSWRSPPPRSPAPVHQQEPGGAPARSGQAQGMGSRC